MGAKHLSDRDNWQTESAKKALKNEQTTFSLLKENLSYTQYKVTRKPTIRIGEVNKQPEAVIENLQTGKKLLIDDKYGEKGGNAHERAYFYTSNNSAEEAGFIPLLVFSGRTFAAKEKYHYLNKEGKKKWVDPEKYRREFRSVLKDSQYFIFDLEKSNWSDFIKQIRGLLA